MSRSARTSSRASSSGARPYLWVVGVLVLAVAAAVIMAMTRDDGSTDDAAAAGSAIAETNDVAVVGAPFAVLDGVDGAVGSPAPQATGTNFQGDEITLLDPGTPAVIGFFAHWCPHCQAEVDELSKHLATVGLPDDVDVIAVSTGVAPDRGNFPPSAWFESEGWSTPILVDDASGSVAEAYGLSGFPFWAIVDADGELMQRSSGGIGSDQFDAFVELARSGA